MTTPQPHPGHPGGACAIGCGLIVALFFIMALAGSCSGSSGGSGGSTRDDCRSRYEGVGDGTVDWRGICDVK